MGAHDADLRFLHSKCSSKEHEIEQKFGHQYEKILINIEKKIQNKTKKQANTKTSKILIWMQIGNRKL